MIDRPTQQTPEMILKTVFGFDRFYPLQREIIQNVLDGKDTLAVMPTGGGKSLCYQIPALMLPGVTVVVSPLIALMKDQVEQMQALGIPALFLNSSLSLEEYRINAAQVRAGTARLVYAAPETLLTDRFLALLDGTPVNCLAVDEAHCISEWGHDFRPEYRLIGGLRKRFHGAPCLALTATATPRVQADITRSLQFDEARVYVASFDRKNLFLEVAPKTDGLGQTLSFLERFRGQPGIIYCFSRKGVDTLAAALARRGFAALPYHAGMADDDRRRNQERFIRDDAQIIVATIAFGMGINKPNVRFVVHYDMPKSIEGYYQEIGRAGRDGLPAHCMLLFSYADLQKHKIFLNEKEGQERDVAAQHLREMAQYAESLACRRAPLLQYFGERYDADRCENCDRCLAAPVEEVDMTIPAQKLLSCVKRTGEVFGLAHVVDVLLGVDTPKVVKNRHEGLSVFGIGGELGRDAWMHLGKQLLQKGLLEQEARFGSLRLTPTAAAALRAREPIFIARYEAPRLRGKQASGAAGAYDRDLFEILRAKRKALADEAGLPPYVIFSDKTLAEMAAYYPMQPESLAKIHGVGAVKLERYGETFLDDIRAYCAHRGLQEGQKPGLTGPGGKDAGGKETGGQDRKLRHLEVGEAYQAGSSLEALCTRLQIAPATLLDHLHRWVSEGNPLVVREDIRSLIQAGDTLQADVLAAFTALGAERLRPIFDRLGERVRYDDLKILRLVYLGSRQGIDSHGGDEAPDEWG